jgi:hypothetical protein
MHYRPLVLCTVIALCSYSPTSVAAAAPDIVLYATDVSHFTGLSLEADTTAAGGWKLSSRDEGRSSPNQPPPAASAATASFIIDVPAAATYRFWIRLRGKGNSKFNESVWVHFSDATRNGNPVYRWGTNNGLLVNLENCSGCGIQEWGWQDNSWWLNQSSRVTLPAGPQHVYVAVREDGVEFDQIVLSPERFLTSAPGPVKNDQTILAKSTNERITMTGIDFAARDGVGRFRLTGSNQFSLTASVGLIDGGSGALISCTGVAGCPADTQVPFRGDWRGLDVHDLNVSNRGTTYPSNGFEDPSTIALLVNGFVKTPSGVGRRDGELVRAEATWHLGTVFNYVGSPGQPTGRALLVGGGWVVFHFRWSEVDQAWYLDEGYFGVVDPTVSAPDPNEVVLYATDVVTLAGLSLVDDSTAAGGKKISSVDQGRQWLNTPPVPNDAPYATFSFNVPATGNYRVWLRMRGQRNSKFNESVWVQFSHALRNNAPVYRWGSNSGLLINLENCSACGIQEWGWQDNSWWLNQSSVVQLGEGMHNLYVTLREDGVEFDQIVLSRVRYFTEAPGPVKNDNTIVTKPAVADQVHISNSTFSTVFYDGEVGTLELVGADGFNLNARFTRLGGAPDGVLACGTTGCEPGSLQSINGYWSGDDFTGTANYRRRQYDFADDLNGGEVQFRGFVRIPAAGASTAVISAPYTFYGTVFYSDDGVSQKTVRYFSGGEATFELRFEPNDGLWYIDQYRFSIERPSQPSS